MTLSFCFFLSATSPFIHKEPPLIAAFPFVRKHSSRRKQDIPNPLISRLVKNLLPHRGRSPLAEFGLLGLLLLDTGSQQLGVFVTVEFECVISLCRRIDDWGRKGVAYAASLAASARRRLRAIL